MTSTDIEPMKNTKFGLIGHPIAHSLSPALFKAAYNGKYPYDLIESEDFETAYERFLNEYVAVNVTAPFKELAFRKADIVRPECEAIGAANILIRTPDGVVAANSDHFGVIGAMMAGLYPDKTIKPEALIVGCGGAAKAAAYACLEIDYKVTVINRNYEKARDFAMRVSSLNPSYRITARPLENFSKAFKDAGVIIYTLPVAIDALHELKRKDIRGNILRKEDKVIVEANYKDPAFTPELIESLQRVNQKLIYVSGQEWLLHQAIGAYLSFTGEEPNIEQMRKVL